MRKLMIATTALLGLAACNAEHRGATGTPIANGAHAIAALRTPDGADIGRATVTEVSGGLRVTLDLHGLPAGTHGAHIHTVGKCDAPDFATAGGHWNPLGTKHGAMNPQGPHAGDMPNLVIGADGRGAIGAVLPAVTMASLLDSDGAAVVIHEKPDDLMTDPSGNSGARLACGVIVAS